MPTADGRFRGISVPADAWERVFGRKPFDPAQAGRRAVEKHGEALRRLAD